MRAIGPGLVVILSTLTFSVTALAPGAASAQLTQDEILTALGATAVPPAQGGFDPALTTVTLSSDVRQTAVYPGLGSLKPLEGTTFLYMSTGVAGATTTLTLDATALDTQPGTTVGTACANPDEYDCVSLSINTDVPPGMNSVEFGFDFLSVEYPEYVNTAFNDEFSVTLVRPTVSIPNITLDFDGTPINVNNGFFSQHCSQLFNTGFEIYLGGSCDAGATGVLTTRAPVAPGENITLIFFLRDRGDAVWDSSLLLDNLRFFPDSIPAPETGGAVQIERVDNPLGGIEGGREILVFGNGFENVEEVKFGTVFDQLVDAASFEEIDANHLRVITPPHPVGIVHLVITARPRTNSSTGVLADGYQYISLSERPGPENGCSCRIDGPSRAPTNSVWLVAGVALLALVRRRRR